MTISEPLAEHLGREGFDAEVAGTIEAATNAWRATPPDLIVLDVMLPEGDGRDLCRLLAGRIRRTPIIMLTAKGEESIASSASNWAPTITWSSRSPLASSSRACGR